MIFFFFFFNDTATTEIYTFPYTTLFRSRRDADRRREPRRAAERRALVRHGAAGGRGPVRRGARHEGVRDRKSTRLNSSHLVISYAVFCLKKKKEKVHTI